MSELRDFYIYNKIEKVLNSMSANELQYLKLQMLAREAAASVQIMAETIPHVIKRS